MVSDGETTFSRLQGGKFGTCTACAALSAPMKLPDDNDADAIMLRLLCEKAQERLDRTWAAADFGHRTMQLPDGTYVWAKDSDPPAYLQSR